MAGIKDLQTIIRSMEPVFATLGDKSWSDIANLQPISVFMEDEGVSVVISKEAADKNDISYNSVFRLISLRIHSSLDAVGLTAAFSTALANHGISANVVAAYYHDHIFVPSDEAEEAITILQNLSKNE